MHSKNKKAMTAKERTHVEAIKNMPCAICEAPPISEAHEVEQGLWHLSIPLCADCHRGSKNGIHGQKNIWRVMGQTENTALNQTIARMYG
jgi:hypothetical protein